MKALPEPRSKAPEEGENHMDPPMGNGADNYRGGVPFGEEAFRAKVSSGWLN